MAKNTKSKCPEVTDELIREIIGPSSDGSPNGRIFRKGEKKLISLLQKTDSTEYALRLINACIDYGIRIRFDERIQKLTGRLNKCSSIKAKEDLLAGELEDLQEEAWYWEEDGQSEPPHLSIEDESYWRRACEGVKLKRSNTRERILGWNLDQIRRGISSKIEGIINGEYYRISQEKIFELQEAVKSGKENEATEQDQPSPKAANQFLKLLCISKGKNTSPPEIYTPVRDAFHKNTSQKTQAQAIFQMFDKVKWKKDKNGEYPLRSHRENFGNSVVDKKDFPEIQKKILPYLPEVLQGHINEIITILLPKAVVQHKKADL